MATKKKAKPAPKKIPAPRKSPILSAVEKALAAKAQAVTALVIAELAKTAKGNAPVLAFLDEAYKRVGGKAGGDDGAPEAAGPSDVNGQMERTGGS